MSYQPLTAETNHVCVECGCKGILIFPGEFGWKVQCQKNSHEIFPYPDKSIVIREIK